MKTLLFVVFAGSLFAQAVIPTASLCPVPQITVVTPTVGPGTTYTAVTISCLSYDATVTLTTSTKPWTMTAASAVVNALSLVIPPGITQGSFFACGGGVCLASFNSISFTYMVAPPAGPGLCPGLTSNGSGQYAVDAAGYLYFCAAPTPGPAGGLAPSSWYRTAAPMVTTWTP